jgi:hypothetical protein
VEKDAAAELPFRDAGDRRHRREMDALQICYVRAV